MDREGVLERGDCARDDAILLTSDDKNSPPR